MFYDIKFEIKYMSPALNSFTISQNMMDVMFFMKSIPVYVSCIKYLYDSPKMVNSMFFMK